jgi:hypothetical protein
MPELKAGEVSIQELAEAERIIRSDMKGKTKKQAIKPAFLLTNDSQIK